MNEENKNIVFSVSYIAKEKHPFSLIEKSMKKVLFTLMNKLAQTSETSAQNIQ